MSSILAASAHHEILYSQDKSLKKREPAFHAAFVVMHFKQAFKDSVKASGSRKSSSISKKPSKQRLSHCCHSACHGPEKAAVRLAESRAKYSTTGQPAFRDDFASSLAEAFGKEYRSESVW